MAHSNMTELDAVNQMLLTIGEQKVNTLESSGLLEANVALETLRNTSREVQAEGWNFNTENKVTLLPDIHGQIVVPQNCIDAWKPFMTSPRIVLHGHRLHNLTRQTYFFDRPVTLSLLYCRDFDVLIPTAKIYIAQRAARIFQEYTTGSQVTDEFVLRREAQARIQLEAADARDAGYNILKDSPRSLSAYARDRL